jgi:hypothetical protein
MPDVRLIREHAGLVPVFDQVKAVNDVMRTLRAIRHHTPHSTNGPLAAELEPNVTSCARIHTRTQFTRIGAHVYTSPDGFLGMQCTPQQHLLLC